MIETIGPIGTIGTIGARGTIEMIEAIAANNLIATSRQGTTSKKTMSRIRQDTRENPIERRKLSIIKEMQRRATRLGKITIRSSEETMARMRECLQDKITGKTTILQGKNNTLNRISGDVEEAEDAVEAEELS
jgi:hypothetical protein